MKMPIFHRVLSALLAVILVAALLPASAFPVRAESRTYVLSAADHLAVMDSGAKKDGETEVAGTDDYFTVHYSGSTKIELRDSAKTFDDGYVSAQRLNFNGAAQIGSTIKNCVEFTTQHPAVVKLWWVKTQADSRQMGIYDAEGTVLMKTADELAKDQPCLSTFTLEDAGQYYLGGVGNKNYIFKIEVTEYPGGITDVERGPWANVAAPEILSAADNGSGKLSVTVQADVGLNGGDKVLVTMYDSAGNALGTEQSTANASSHTLSFQPDGSGEYTFRATLQREGEEDKQAAESITAPFSLPLASPTILSATSKGDGKAELIWVGVKEAERYDISCDGTVIGSTTETQYTAEDLTVDQTYIFRIIAVRGEDTAASAERSVQVTQQSQQTWGFTYYGPSTNASDNGYVGNLITDGQVTVFSENGKGKITPKEPDGIAFYYTAIPTEYNFTLRAKVTVDSWTYSNGQEGFGLLVTDRLGPSGDRNPYWNNQFMAVATKIEYRYQGEDMVTNLDGTGTKYTMKLGLGVLTKTGITEENLPLFEANDSAALNQHLSALMDTLEWSAGLWDKESGTYNIVGNYTPGNNLPEDIERDMKTSFILEIQKNNTGYFITYYAEDGTVLCQRKYYGADALNQLDEDYVYAGFFASRNARATFSDVTFTTILASEDAPAEEKPVTTINPTVSISSPSVTTSPDYILAVDSNVSGTVKVTLEGKVIVEADPITANVRYIKTLTLANFNENDIRVEFTPDPDQDLGPDTVLGSTKKVFADITVVYNKGNYHRKTIYVSPTGLPNGTGSKEYPFDIYTAVNNALPGQTILLMEGTYQLDSTVRIQRGMDGTPTEPIRMIADPEAASRPVLDFQQLCAGIVHGGDYWYFAGFDVCNSQAGQKGFQVSGNYNILDQIHAYHNGNSGIQLSRYSGTDLFPDWPAHNLVLNCTSYGNADAGEEDADGFAAKLTVGEGNVFDGCVAYNNADDGYDLYAKIETGPIGVVTIRNCVAYANGIREDGTISKGNGNGFKLGGSSITGKHVLENSYAFYNKAKGIDSNSCPDVVIKNCVSYNNGTYNVALYTNNSANTDFSATGIVSFKDNTIPAYGDLGEGDNLKPKGTQDTAKYLGDTNYYWDGSACANASGKRLGAEVFVSLQFKGVARHADGTIDMQGFLERSDQMPADTGVQPGGTASTEIGKLPEDLAHSYSDTFISIDLQIHWRECECGDKTDIGEHDLVWVIDKEATDTQTGLKHRECTVCGHKKAAVTIYPGEDDPVQPSTGPTEPAGSTDATQPSTGSQVQDPDPAGPSPVVIAIAVICILAIGAFVIVKFVIKKKK